MRVMREKRTIRTQKNHKTGLRIFGFILALFLTAHLILSNFFIDALLIPSFMEKLSSFDRVTKKSLNEQMHTSDIVENHMAAKEAAEAFVSSVERERLTVTSSDGYRLVAEAFLQPEESHDWVLLCHGYTARKEDMEVVACRYYEMGYNTLLPDLRCQGESEGDYIGMGLTDSRDCLLWLDLILAKDPKASIVLHGQSMGAATVLTLSAEPSLPKNVICAISDCSFESAIRMGNEKIWDWFHIPSGLLIETAVGFLLLRGGYNLKKASPLLYVRESTLPTLFFHGTDDRFVSVDQAYDLYNEKAGKKELVIVEGAGHAQSQDKDPAAFYDKIFSFIDSCRSGKR